MNQVTIALLEHDALEFVGNMFDELLVRVPLAFIGLAQSDCIQLSCGGCRLLASETGLAWRSKWARDAIN